MENGPYILSIKSGYYPYVLVGECEIKGMEVIVRGGRIIRRFGTNYSIAQLSTEGPISSTILLPPSVEEVIWRSNISRPVKTTAAILKKFMEFK